MNKTRKGVTCQRWDSQTPHAHTLTSDTHPKAGLDENFCRNPDGEPRGPWCYTTSSKKRWDYCDVPSCGKLIYTHVSIVESSTKYLAKRSPIFHLILWTFLIFLGLP